MPFNPNGSSLANGGSYMGDPGFGVAYPLPMVMRAMVLPHNLRPV